LLRLLIALTLVAAFVGFSFAGEGRTASSAAPVVTNPRSDFNGDGFADLAIGVPGEDVGIHPDAGAVEVMYGSAGGLTTSGDQFWTQDSPGVTDQTSTGDRFGMALAPADFNGDGCYDLAIGVPFEDLFGTDEGVVQVLYGSLAGLQADVPNDQVWRQGAHGVQDEPEDRDRFGYALAGGDFNGDGYADLAVGVPLEGIGDDPAKEDAGAVEIIYGSSAGLQTTAPADHLWTQDSKSVKDHAEASDVFGSVLAAGDFDNSAHDDLAIGVYAESLTRAGIEEGGVEILYGSDGGLQATAPDDQFWTQDSPGVKDSAEGDDHFGYALATGDLGNGGDADLAIGVPGESPPPPAVLPEAGAVAVLYGSGGGLQAVAPNDQLWTQDSPGIAEAGENLDRFGSALAIGDLGFDVTGDLVVGVPQEDLDDGENMEAWGVVHVIYGSASGLTSAGSQLWSQDAPGVADQAEAGDEFGYALTVLELGNGPKAGMVISVPFEDLGIDDVGAIHVLYGSAGGVTTAGARFLGQNSPGVEDQAEEGDAFGLRLG
jgi:hypothetical protein